MNAMARPSKKAERVEEILEGVETCVTQYGIDGTTLDLIASATGLARPLIRHNLGNRDQIMEAFMKRYFERSDAETRLLELALDEVESFEGLVKLVFVLEQEEKNSILVAQALNIAAANNEQLAEQLRQWTDNFTRILGNVLARLAPKASAESRNDVAVGLVNLYLSAASYAPLNPENDFAGSIERVALILLRSLEA